MINVGGKNVSKQVSELKADTTQRGINLKYPPAPLVAVVADGITDDAAAINNALSFASLNSYEVYFPAGVCLVNSPIVWDGKTVVRGTGIYSVIKAGASMSHVVVADKDSLNLIQNGSYRTGRWLNVSIDANHLANYGFYVKRGKGGEFAFSGVQGAIIANIHLGDVDTVNGSNAWEWNIHDLYISGGTDADRPNYGIKVTSKFVDSTIQNVVINNAKITHLYNQGTTIRWFNIHTYSYPNTQMVDTMIYAGGQGCQFDQLYIDTPGRRGLYITASGQRFKGMYILVPDLLDAVSAKPLIYIDTAANAVMVDEIITNIPITIDSAKRSLIRNVEVDNTPNNIFDLNIGKISNMGAIPNEDIKLTGKVPTRFSHATFTGTATNPYYVGQEYFNKDIYSGDSVKDFTFKNEMQNNVYNVLVEPFWNTNWFITNKTTTGFRVNFGTALPSGSGFFQIRIFPRG